MKKDPNTTKPTSILSTPNAVHLRILWPKYDSPTCETAVTLRVLRNLRSRVTNAEGPAAVALVNFVR